MSERIYPPAAWAIERLIESARGHDMVVKNGAWLDDTLAGAAFSRCGRWRYLLWRVWDPGQPIWSYGMLNPSTADHIALDPTVTRCQKRAWQGGAGGLIVWNLFAYRATDPAVMKRHEAPIGPENDNAILYAVRDSLVNIAAWGVDGEYLGRARTVLQLLDTAGVRLHALTFTKTGQPRHPLYVSGHTEARPWEYQHA